MPINIIVTNRANQYLKHKIEQENGIGFRLSVKKTGCSGFAYVPSVIKVINPTDELIECDNDVKVFIDTTWLMILDGLEIDYIEEEKMGLKQKRLVYTNTKEGARCGCGESFVMKSENNEQKDA